MKTNTTLVLMILLLIACTKENNNRINTVAEKNNSVLKSLTEKIKWEHTKSFSYLNDFKEMTNNYQTPSHACLYYISLFEKMQELEHDLKLHFQLEDDILFDKIIYH